MDWREIGRLRAALAAVGLLVATVGGAFGLGLVGAPSVVAVENRFGEVTNETTTVHTDLVVDNPNPIGVTLGGTTVNYTVRMNGVRMAAGEKEGLSVAPGNSTLAFTTAMNNTQIPAWWVTHVRNDERTNVTVDADVHTSLLGERTFDFRQDQTVRTDLIGAFASNETRPVEGPPSPLYSNPVLYVNRTDAAWGTVTADETPIATEFVVYNPKSVPFAVTEIGYEIRMNGVLVGGGTSDRSYVIPAGATETVRARTAMRNARLDEWWVSHLRNDQVTELRIDFHARIELPTGTTFRVPLDALTYTETFETDIFGTKNETASGGAAHGASGATATPAGTDGGGANADGATAGDSGTPTVGADDGGTRSPTGTGTDGGLLGGVWPGPAAVTRS